jgi:DNA ligase-1
MADLADGESIQVQGSGSSPYTLKNIGGVYSCTCPAWRNQSAGIESRTCKHLRKLRGDAAEEARLGASLPVKVSRKSADGQDVATVEAPVLLADAWDGVVDVTDWWISEKLDGVRAYWDGTKFLSRLGNTFVAPAWFTEGLPAEPLDGELWLGRKQFQKTVSIVRRKDQSDHWRQIRYVVFDAPGLKEPFEQRMDYLNDLVLRGTPEFTIAHEHSRCQGLAHLKDELQRVEALGGEGLMLRQPASLYVAGRSATLLKVKTFQDAEARVLGHLPGAGRHKGRLGALQVALPDGTEFSVGTGFSDAERENPPAIGSSITFRYQELSDGGVPRFPSYPGLRKDDPGIVVASMDTPSPAKRASTKGASTKQATIQSAESTDAAAMSSGQSVAVSATKGAMEGTETPSNKASTKAQTRPSKSVPTKSAVLPATTDAKEPRLFTYEDDKSNKFWEIQISELDVTVRFGRTGTQGQSQLKSFPDAAAARKHADKLIAEKTAKGYVEQES